MECVPNQTYDEFQYIEFIRNPVIQKIDLKELKNIRCVALDYFDFIYTKEVNSFSECMVSENDIPCEAYQSIGLFRKKKKDEKNIDPFSLSAEIPFLAILQITYTPDSYSIRNEKLSTELSNDIAEIENIINNASAECFEKIAQANNCNKEEYKLNFKVYNTVNTMDYCIVLSTNYLDFPVYLSDIIRRQRIEKDNVSYLKYAVYAVMGVSDKFRYTTEDNHKYMSSDTVMVTRVHLAEKFFENGNSEFINFLDKEKTKTGTGIITDTHSLPGRYDLSIRLNGYDNVVKILPFVLKSIMETFFGNNENTSVISGENLIRDTIDNTNTIDNIIESLVIRGEAQYINVRMFFSSINNLSESINTKTLSINENNKILDSVISLFDEIKGELNKFEMPGYTEKIHNIVHIYTALYSRYDTNISMRMLGSYLDDFLALLKMNLSFIDRGIESPEDFKINLISGINYLQKYIEIITSVNSTSFEAPKYEVEKDECCIVKLPIAYTTFLKNVFNDYYKKREIINDSEFKYFPKYKPLVIPYMHTIQGYQGDYMMTTLFAQDLPDDWNFTCKDWEKYIEKFEVPMYIICQDMSKYKDISSMIISSFHELGHYCNGMNREERNCDIAKIYLDEVSKSIVKKLVSMSDTSYQLQNLSLIASPIFQHLNNCIYNQLVNFMLEDQTNEKKGKMNEYINYPLSIFREKFCNTIYRLFHTNADCNSKNLLKQQLNESYLQEYDFIFGRNDDEKVETDNEGELFKFIINNCIDKFAECVKSVEEKNKKTDNAASVNQLNEIINTLNEIRVHLKDNKIADSSKINDDAYATFSQDYINNSILKLKELFDNLSINENRNCDNDSEIKDELNSCIKCLAFYLRTLDKYTYFYLVDDANDFLGRKELATIITYKKEIIDGLAQSYFDDINNQFENIQFYYYELYRNLELCPDSDKEEFKKLINNALKGLSVPTDTMDLWGSCYAESIADIVMCINLNLSLEEYLIDIADLYTDIADSYSVHTVARLIIVSAFLLFKKEFDTKYSAEDVESRNKLYEKILHNFKGCFDKEMEKDYETSLENIIKLIHENYSKILKTKLFEVTFERIFNSMDKMKIITDNNQYDISFIKKSIKLRNSANINTQEIITEKTKLQNCEIDFILKYYYENRVKYSPKFNNNGN